MFCCAQPCQCVLSQLQPLAKPHSRSVALNWPTFAELTMRTIPRDSEHCVFPIFMWNELSVQSGAHFADYIFQRWFERLSCLTCWNVNLALLQCGAHSADIALWSANQALATVLCTFCQQFPRSSPASAETETLLWRPQKPLYPKKHMVSRPRVFTREFTHLRLTWSWHDHDIINMICDQHDENTSIVIGCIFICIITYLNYCEFIQLWHVHSECSTKTGPCLQCRPRGHGSSHREASEHHPLWWDAPVLTFTACRLQILVARCSKHFVKSLGGTKGGREKVWCSEIKHGWWSMLVRSCSQPFECSLPT